MDRVIVITGGTSGIGLELKKLYESNGDKVITISRREAEGEHHAVDVANEKKVTTAIEKIAKKYGKIDVLINSAGFGISGITELTPTDNWKSVMEVNFNGTMYATRAALKYMEKGGRVVNISSAMALFPVPFRAYYAAAKSAVLTMSYALRMELKPLGIDVVAICPGDIRTSFTANRIKNYDSDPRYGDRLYTATEKCDARESKRMSAETCGKKIYRIINKKHTRPYYIIGGKYKALHLLTRLTPKSWLLNATGKIMG